MEKIFYGIHETSFGSYLLIATSDHQVLFGAFVDDEKKETLFLRIKKMWPTCILVEDKKSTQLLTNQAFDPIMRDRVPLSLHGTPFQKAVWQALLGIKEGEVTTYALIAQQIGRPTAVRAVANAIANNNIAVLVPCHRVIATSGAVGGYRWGVARKQALLSSEQK